MMQTVALVTTLLVAGSCVYGQASGSTHNASAFSTRAIEKLPHDSHEGLVVSADSYADLSRAKEKFGKVNPLPVGILPVEIFLRNDTTQALRINLRTIQLTVHFLSGRQQGIDWLQVEDVASAVAHPKGQPAPKARHFPIGLPSTKDPKTEKILEILRPFALDADVVPPMATIHGFLFFDLDRDISLADNASLYLPNVTTIPSNKALLFFEVPLSGRTIR
jgi:hypothetical protein